MEKVKSGNRGGKRYPKLTLEKTLKYTNRLISKTKATPLPRKTVLSKVFDSATWLGIQRLSSTKQYGLLEGNAKGYEASNLAKDLKTATKDQAEVLLQEACLNPDIFSALYSKYANQSVSLQELGEYTGTLGVNPNNSQDCVKNFVESLLFSGLGKMRDKDTVQIGEIRVATPRSSAVSSKGKSEAVSQLKVGPSIDDERSSAASASGLNAFTSNVNVNIDIGSTTDPSNLEKCLSLLKKFGAI